MTNTKLVFVGTSFALVLAGCATSEPKSGSTQPPTGYALYGQGKDTAVVRTGSGGCLHTSDWTPDKATPECEPELTARAAPEPQQEAALTEAPPAEPAVADAEQPSAPETERVYVGTDAYFAFNQATLEPEARAKLDKVAARAKDGREPSIEIRGYADPIGSDQYNMDLSQRRADAVRTYLVEQGVADDAIRVEARGEIDPGVRCEGRPGKELIQCLQPDRVTEVIYSAIEEVAAPQ